MNNIKRFGSSHNICILCSERKKLKTITWNDRLNALKTARVYIPSGARICTVHGHVDWNEVSHSAVICEFNARYIEEMVELALSEDEENAEFPDINVESNTGLTLTQFDQLFSCVPSLVATMPSAEQAKRALLMLLMRYRKAASYEYIGTACGISASKASMDIRKARFALTRDVVPNYLGFENLGRGRLLQNTTVLARMLHCDNNADKLITIWDGTYIFVNKSSNYEFQKLTYNAQKSSNFLRPMMCVTTNGYIIDVFGPFEAVKNDAKCMLKILETDLNETEIIRSGDVFLFDRGFRDCLEMIANRGYVAKTPEFVKRNHPTQQLTTEQANRSRLVTKNRFAVEARNGHMKTIFPMFDMQWSTKCVHSLGEDLRIAAALINKFFCKIEADAGEEEAVANAMLARMSLPNVIHPIVQQDMFLGHLEFFEEVDENTFVFPELTKEELSRITLGSYQLRQAKSYACAHKKTRIDFQYLCYRSPDPITRYFFADVIRDKNVLQPVLVSTIMASRFRSRKKHESYILADASKNGPDGIIGYCCQCQHGLRTVGCCSHVATTIFYLGYARHNGGVMNPAGYLDGFFEGDSQSSSGEDD